MWLCSWLDQISVETASFVFNSLALVLIIIFVSSQIVSTTQMCSSLLTLWTKTGDVTWRMEKRILGTHRRLVEYPQSHTRLHILPDCNTHKNLFSGGTTGLKHSVYTKTHNHIAWQGMRRNMEHFWIWEFVSHLWGICSYFDPLSFPFYLSVFGGGWYLLQL